MSQALSPSFARCYGLARVARVWKISRASHLHGEGYRKLWARLRFAGVRASPRRVRRGVQACRRRHPAFSNKQPSLSSSAKPNTPPNGFGSSARPFVACRRVSCAATELGSKMVAGCSVFV
jgi:hypothetical protein